MVEGQNEARGQMIGRTSQNKTLNFTAPESAVPAVGSYVNVSVTRSFPNSLLGEMVYNGARDRRGARSDAHEPIGFRSIS